MPPDERQLAEDRALRDAARAIFLADVAIVRDTPRALADRLGEKMGKAKHQTGEFASDNRAALATGLTAALGVGALWIFRSRVACAISQIRRTLRREPQDRTPR